MNIQPTSNIPVVGTGAAAVVVSATGSFLADRSMGELLLARALCVSVGCCVPWLSGVVESSAPCRSKDTVGSASSAGLTGVFTGLFK